MTRATTIRLISLGLVGLFASCVSTAPAGANVPGASDPVLRSEGVSAGTTTVRDATSGNPTPRVSITDFYASNDLSRITFTANWDKKLLDRPGREDALRVSVWAAADSSSQSVPQLVYSSDDVDKARDPLRESKVINLSSDATRAVSSAAVAGVTISQQYENPRDGNQRFDVGLVSVHVFRGEMEDLWGHGDQARDCSGVLIKPKADLRRCNLAGARLRAAEMDEVKLDYANIWAAILEGSDLTGVHASRIAAEGANLSHAKLGDAVAPRADLRGADLRESTLHRSKLTSAKLDAADLRHADLRGITLDRAVLRLANASGANFSYGRRVEKNTYSNSWALRSSLEGTIFERAKLRKADLRGANLIRANFGFSDLEDANFMNVTPGGPRNKLNLQGSNCQKIRDPMPYVIREYCAGREPRIA